MADKNNHPAESHPLCPRCDSKSECYPASIGRNGFRAIFRVWLPAGVQSGCSPAVVLLSVMKSLHAWSLSLPSMLE
jgi:hypothetical protein